MNDKVYATANELAQEFGITEAWVSKVLQVARLPEDVIKAFPNPLEITSKMGADLAAAFKDDPDAVCYRALELQEPQDTVLTASEVFARLMFEGGESRTEKPKPLSLGDKAKPFGKMGRDAKGRLCITLSEDFGFDDRRKFEALAIELAKGKEQFLPPVKKPRKSKKPSVAIHAAGGFKVLIFRGKCSRRLVNERGDLSLASATTS